jgi:hypothetical protein
MCISFTLVTHIILVLMVLPNFWNPLLSLIPFWRAVLALVLECYVDKVGTNSYGIFALIQTKEHERI